MNTYLISIYLHVIFSAFWIGGMLFLPLILLPSIKNNPERTHLLFHTGIKFRFYGWIALIGLIITGIINMQFKNFSFNIEFLTNNQIGKLLGIKLLLFCIMIAISGLHDFYIGTKTIEQIQQNKTKNIKQLARWSGRINLLIALSIAFLGVIISRGGF
ncbi:MAG: CopD family protein [Flavobacteriales bacterium]|nr:CopD family protein [Flavobacteriales bacterium]